MSDAIKRLYRSRTDRMIWGVCGGLGEYFNVDPTLFRALFVLLALFNGVGLFLYVFLAIVIPNESLVRDEKDAKSNGKTLAEEVGEMAREIMPNNEAGLGKRNMLGFFIVILGLILLAGQFSPYYFRWLTWETIGAAMIILAGIYLITKK